MVAQITKNNRQIDRIHSKRDISDMISNILINSWFRNDRTFCRISMVHREVFYLDSCLHNLRCPRASESPAAVNKSTDLIVPAGLKHSTDYIKTISAAVVE